MLTPEMGAKPGQQPQAPPGAQGGADPIVDMVRSMERPELEQFALQLVAELNQVLESSAQGPKAGGGTPPAGGM